MRHLLLDLDGTLTDPRPGIVRCIRHALAAVGRDRFDDDALVDCIGPPLAESFARLLESSEPSVIARAIALYRERFASVGMYENAVYPGIDTLLERLRTTGFRLLLATSKPRPFAARIVEHFGLATHLHAVYGSELDGTRADKSSLIEHLLASEGIAAGDAVMIGDRRHDIEGARSHGLAAVGVLWGYGGRDELDRAGATALCTAPEALPAILQQLIERRLS